MARPATPTSSTTLPPATTPDASTFGVSVRYSLAAVPIGTSYRWLVAAPWSPGEILPRAIEPVAAPRLFSAIPGAPR